MKSFKDYGSLSEGSFKEGSVMEGLFAIAVALYLRDGEIPSVAMVRQKQKLVKIGTKPWKTRYGPVWDNIGKNPKDEFLVYLSIELKAGEMIKKGKNAFGTDGIQHFAKVGEIPSLDAKVATMLAQLKGTNALKKIDKHVNKIMSNKTSDDVKLYVKAEGSIGDSGTGEMKADVNVVINVKYGKQKGKKTKKKSPKDLNLPLAFSLKSDSHTFANLSAWKGIQALANKFSVPFNIGAIKKIKPNGPAPYNWDGEALIRLLSTKIDSGNVKAMKAKRLATAKMFDNLIDKLNASSNSNIKKVAFQILNDASFGSDNADILDFREGKIIEIIKDTVNEIETSDSYSDYEYSLDYNYAVDKSGKDLVGTIGGGTGGITINVTYTDSDGTRKTEEFWTARAKLLMNYGSKSGEDQIELKILIEGGDFIKKYGGKTLPPVSPKKQPTPAAVAAAIKATVTSEPTKDTKKILQRVDLDDWLLDEKNLLSAAKAIKTAEDKAAAASEKRGSVADPIYTGFGNLSKKSVKELKAKVKLLRAKKRKK
jgi:hypothetical protein